MGERGEAGYYSYREDSRDNSNNVRMRRGAESAPGYALGAPSQASAASAGNLPDGMDMRASVAGSGLKAVSECGCLDNIHAL